MLKEEIYISVYLCTHTYICTCIHRHTGTHICAHWASKAWIYTLRSQHQGAGWEGFLLSRAPFSSTPSRTGEKSVSWKPWRRRLKGVRHLWVGFAPQTGAIGKALGSSKCCMAACRQEGAEISGAALHICTWQVYSLKVIMPFIRSDSHFNLAL